MTSQFQLGFLLLNTLTFFVFFFFCFFLAGPHGLWASLVAQLVKNPPAMQEISVQFLGLEDPLEEGMATQSSILAWRLPMDRGAWRATVHGVAKNQIQLSD